LELIIGRKSYLAGRHWDKQIPKLRTTRAPLILVLAGHRVHKQAIQYRDWIQWQRNFPKSEEESAMFASPDKMVASRKIGSEDIIILNVPIDRFRGGIPAHYNPQAVSKSRYRVALLAQACKSYSFDNDEVGWTDEFHFWIWIASSNPGTVLKGVDIMLPSMDWFALASATSNATARNYLRSFGFSPLDLEKSDLQGRGGSLAFADGGRITWTIVGEGKEPNCVGVNHVIFVVKDGPGAAGHHVAALLNEAVMERHGRVHIQTDALEPFLFRGERIPAVINRVPKLEADILWRRH
jgi:hypothetical protein